MAWRMCQKTNDWIKLQEEEETKEENNEPNHNYIGLVEQFTLHMAFINLHKSQTENLSRCNRTTHWTMNTHSQTPARRACKQTPKSIDVQVAHLFLFTCFALDLHSNRVICYFRCHCFFLVLFSVDSISMPSVSEFEHVFWFRYLISSHSFFLNKNISNILSQRSAIDCRRQKKAKLWLNVVILTHLWHFVSHDQARNKKKNNNQKWNDVTD